MSRPPYAAVVVLHRSAPELETLLGSLDACRCAPAQLVVVDTGPPDGGSELAHAHGVEVVELRENPGFGAACNAGLARVRQPVTVFLNPDCEALDRSLVRLAEIAALHPGRLHAPRLLNRDGSIQRSAHALPGTLGSMLPALVHPPLLPEALRTRAEPFRAERPRTVGWAIAACLAGSTELLRRLGPFDPGIHLFAEDMDLGLRARAAGVGTVLHPQLRLRHTGGHATLRDDEPYELLASRRRAVVAARRGAVALLLDDAAQTLTFATRSVARLALGRPAEREHAQLAALRSARRGG